MKQLAYDPFSKSYAFVHARPTQPKPEVFTSRNFLMQASAAARMHEQMLKKYPQMAGLYSGEVALTEQQLREAEAQDLKEDPPPAQARGVDFMAVIRQFCGG